MSIRTRLFILVFSILFIIGVPTAWITIVYQKEGILRSFSQKHLADAQMVSSSMVNILLMNGGEIDASSIDAREMIKQLQPLLSQGLVYADIVLVDDSSRGGTLLADVPGNISPEKTRWLKAHDYLDAITRPVQKEISFPGDHSQYFVFMVPGRVETGKTVCVSRLFFSREDVLRPVTDMQNVFILVFSISMLLTLGAGFLVSRSIINPLNHLMEGVRNLEEGNLEYNVAIQTDDEIGHLGKSFNDMSAILHHKIVELEETNQELSRVNHLKDQFLARTSHELRTPLNGILGIVDSLISGAGEHDLGQNLELIQSSGSRLLRLVNDILDVSRLENSDVNLQKKMVDLKVLVDTVIELVKPLRGQKLIKIINDISDEHCAVFGDEERLQQVFINLIENAVKFTDEGEVRVTSNLKDEYFIEYQVADTGIGVDDSKSDLIFEEFQQGDGTITSRYGGSGLGLSIVKRLIELHGGAVSIESGKSSGTVVRVLLPVFRYSEKSIKKPVTSEQRSVPVSNRYEYNAPAVFLDSSDASEGSAASILVVDDEPVNLQVVSNYLKLHNYRVTFARSGVEALEMIKKGFVPDVMLLDVMMPEISGYDVCRQVRKDYNLHELPVLMLTALKRSEDIQAGLSAGANDFLSKPFDKNELLSRIRTLVELKKNVMLAHELKILETELEIARNIQEALLPLEVPSLEGLTMGVLFEPMREVGGDFYDFSYFKEKKLGVFLTDVTGHGAPAAIVSAMIKVAFASSITESEYPEYLMQKINTMLSPYGMGHYATALYALVDLKNMEITVARAAHWPLYILRGDEIIRMRPRGTMLGLVDNTDFSKEKLGLEKGDRLIAFTDGVIEVRSPSGEIYGDARLLDFIKKNRHLPPRETVDKVHKLVRDWQHIGPDDHFEDDMSLLIMDIS